MPPGLRLRNRTVSWPSLASLNPQAWRSMCGCTLNGIFAAFPSFVIILRKPTALMQVTPWLLLALKAMQGAQFGAGEWVDRRYATLEPRDVQPRMCSQRREHSSDARGPCRKASRCDCQRLILISSRLHPFCNDQVRARR